MLITWGLAAALIGRFKSFWWTLAGGLGNDGPSGPHVIRTVAALAKELAATRKRGYATVVEEAEPSKLRRRRRQFVRLPLA